MTLLESAKNGTGRKGRAFLIKYLNGHRLTQQQAIFAKCYDCDGMGKTGLCDIETCSLYPYSQFAPKSASTSVSGKKRISRSEYTNKREIIAVDPTPKAQETQENDFIGGQP